MLFYFTFLVSYLLLVFQSKHFFLNYFFKWLVLAVVIGICIGTASAGFLLSLEWVTSYRENHLWIIALLPIGGLLIGLLYHYYGKSVVAGNSLLLDTIHEPKAVIPFKMAPFVYLGTMVTHLLGGSAGREGTALQMAGAIADQFSKPFQLTNEERKILIIAAIAAGFGSVFGTPIINQPQVGILALGAIRKVPAVIETPEGDFIGIRQKMFLSHSYDHRVVDGALGGSFVKRVADYLEAFDVNRDF